MLLSAAAPHTAPDPRSVYRLVKQRNKQNLALEVKISLPPSLPLTICASSSSSFFHGEELSRFGLRRSGDWDGMELREIGQSKVSFGGRSMGSAVF